MPEVAASLWARHVRDFRGSDYRADSRADSSRVSKTSECASETGETTLYYTILDYTLLNLY